VTREVPKRKDARQDGAEVLCGNLVHAVRGKGEVICDLLRADRRYVAFNGNGHRRGKGYLMVGRKKGGWLAKCGYLPGNLGHEGDWEARSLVPQFLDDLAVVASILDFTVVGIHPGTGQWLDLVQMIQLAQFPHGLDRLQEVHLRIYGPEDYLERCRRFLAERGSFSAIPGESQIERAGPGKPLLDDAGLDLRVRMQQAGITQKELAEHLGVTKGFVSGALNGKKRWSAEMLQRAESYLMVQSGRQAMVEAEVGEPVLYTSA
jgi:hypothetical protein